MLSACMPFLVSLLPLHDTEAAELIGTSGAFLAGIIVPREGNLTIALTEKLEDMVSIIFLPLVSLFSIISRGKI